jgi:uncharacterized membrane protein (UPF0182 family)
MGYTASPAKNNTRPYAKGKENKIKFVRKSIKHTIKSLNDVASLFNSTSTT